MQAVFAVLADTMPGVGLALFLFDEHANEPRANYISNTDRQQTLDAIKEWVARQEAAAPFPAGTIKPHTGEPTTDPVERLCNIRRAHGWTGPNAEMPPLAMPDLKHWSEE